MPSDFSDLDQLDVALRIGISLLLGGILGLERERKDKPAGVRTYGLVCLGSTLFMMSSILIGQQVREDWGTPYDPSRIGSTIVQGIGFIAAGVIFQSRGKIQGLTTAAGVWVTAAVGLLVGAGFFVVAAFAVVSTVVYLVVADYLTSRFFGGTGRQESSDEADDQSA